MAFPPLTKTGQEAFQPTVSGGMANARIWSTEMEQRDVLLDGRIDLLATTSAAALTAAIGQEQAARIAAVDELDDRVTAAETTIGGAIDEFRDELDAFSLSADSIIKGTWAALIGVSGTRDGQRGIVTGPDAGTHTDPVTAATVDNEGTYTWVHPTGWQWLSENVDTSIFDARVTAIEAKTDVAFSSATIPGVDHADVSGVGASSVIMAEVMTDGRVIDHVPGAMAFVAPASNVAIPGNRVPVPQVAGRIGDQHHSWWLYPPVAEMNGSDYSAGVGAVASAYPDFALTYSPIHVAQRRRHSTAWERFRVDYDIFSQNGGDEHNGGSMLLDPRPDALFPVALAQAPHSTGYIRIWRSRTADLRDLEAEPIVVSGLGTVTYTQWMRDPNDPKRVFLWTRSPETGGIWYLLIWNNDLIGQPDVIKPIFQESIISTNDYLKARPTPGGMMLFFGATPSGATPPLTTYFLTWAGALYDYPGGTVIEADIFAITSPFNPLTDGTQIYDPGSARIRMTGVQQVSEHVWHIAGVQGSGGSLSGSVFAMIRVDFSGGAPSVQSVLGPAAGESLGAQINYLGGADAIAENTFVGAAWVANDSSNIAGTTTVSKIVANFGAGTYVATPIATYPKKVGRPIMSEAFAWNGSQIVKSLGSFLVMNEGTLDPTKTLQYHVFSGDRLVFELEDLL